MSLFSIRCDHTKFSTLTYTKQRCRLNMWHEKDCVTVDGKMRWNKYRDEAESAKAEFEYKQGLKADNLKVKSTTKRQPRMVPVKCGNYGRILGYTHMFKCTEDDAHEGNHIGVMFDVDGYAGRSRCRDEEEHTNGGTFRMAWKDQTGEEEEAIRLMNEVMSRLSTLETEVRELKIAVKATSKKGGKKSE